MISQMPDEILLIILSFVASFSIKDVMNVRETCKHLRSLCMDKEVVRNYSLSEIDSVQPQLVVNECKEALFDLLFRSRNAEFCFRMGLMNIGIFVPDVDYAKTLLEIALGQGHDGAKYVMEMLNILSGNVDAHQIGKQMLTDLYRERKLFKCRYMISEAIYIDMYWGSKSWPDNLVYSKVCLNDPANGVCQPVKLNSDYMFVVVDEDYEDNCFLGRRLDLELEWFIGEIGYYCPFLAANVQ